MVVATRSRASTDGFIEAGSLTSVVRPGGYSAEWKHGHTASLFKAQGGRTRVLCFGDSLTAGAVVPHPAPGSSSLTAVTKPYSEGLQRLFGPAADVLTSGYCGDHASNMGGRLQNELDAARKSCRPITHVVILAGTNDLREMAAPEVIVASLVALYSAVHRAGAIAVAVTVPPFGPMDFAYVCQTERRNRVNSQLRSMAAASEAQRGPKLYLVDFDAALGQLPAQVRDSLFSDNVHFTERGYDLLGEQVYAIVSKCLSIGVGSVFDGHKREFRPIEMESAEKDKFAVSTPVAAHRHFAGGSVQLPLAATTRVVHAMTPPPTAWRPTRILPTQSLEAFGWANVVRVSASPTKSPVLVGGTRKLLSSPRVRCHRLQSCGPGFCAVRA